MPLELQAKLLRVLQDKVVERLGSMRSIQCDIRILAATNQDLQQRVKDGRFREDLYFRLAVIPIRIPALRDRPHDILPLANAFLRRYGSTMGLTGLQFSASTEQVLLSYPWPGNVRELENAMQRALLMCDGRLIEPEHVELDVRVPVAAFPLVAPTPGQALGGQGNSLQAEDQAGTDLARNKAPQDIESIERDHILKVLAQVGGNRKEAVAILGLSERALRYKLKAYKEAGFDFD